MRRRLLIRRIAVIAVFLGLPYMVYLMVQKFNGYIQQATDFLQGLEQVNQIHADPLDSGRNRSGVSDDRTRTIVMAKLPHENTTWVAHDLPQWKRAIYIVDDGTPEATTNKTEDLPTIQNKGREANAYLTFLVENYEKLPDFMVFLHSHRSGFPQAWHVDNEAYSNVISVANLRLDFVERNGYANLRCLYQPGCTEPLVPFRSQPNPRLTLERAFPSAWRDLMGRDAPIPRVVATACCAQFAVSKEQVLKRPKADYERYHRWLLDTDLADDHSGRVFEYMWHIIFGQDPVYCPELHMCYCNVYGNCRGKERREQSLLNEV